MPTIAGVCSGAIASTDLYSPWKAIGDQIISSTAPVFTITQPSEISSVTALQASPSAFAVVGGSSETACTAVIPSAPLGWTIHSGSMNASGVLCWTGNQGKGPSGSPTTTSPSI